MKRLSSIAFVVFALFLAFSPPIFAQFDDFFGNGVFPRERTSRTRPQPVVNPSPLRSAMPYRPQRHPVTSPAKTATAYALNPLDASSGRDGPRGPLSLIDYGVSVRIAGFLLEVESTYTFYNPEPRQVEGVLIFSVPTGSTVDGFALDVNGEMIDGVSQEKERATFVFNTIERRGIDPGLVEWVDAGTLKCRIFPIETKQARTIRIRYTAKIDKANYELPIAFNGTVEKFRLNVEVTGPEMPPKTNVDALAFEQQEGKFVAEAEFENHRPTNLTLEFPPLPETAECIAEKNDQGIFFAVRQPKGTLQESLNATRTYREKKLRQPERIAVYWDASGSRAGKGYSREIRLLQRYLSRQRCVIDLYLVRDTMEHIGTFNSSDRALIGQLQDVLYDGATNLAAIGDTVHEADLGILFSDGQSTIGFDDLSSLGMKNANNIPAHPVYFITREPGPAIPVPNLWIESIFDLERDDVRTILDGIGRLTPRWSCDTHPTGSGDYYTLLDDNSLWIFGWMDNSFVSSRINHRFDLHVNYRLGQDAGKPEFRLTNVKVDLASATSPVLEGLPKRMWAQAKLGSLLADPFSRDTARRHALEYQLVSPETSLIVLEELAQYIEFKVEPPASKPDWLEQYRQRIATQKTSNVVSERSVIAQKRFDETCDAADKQFAADWNFFVRCWKEPRDAKDTTELIKRWHSARAYPRVNYLPTSVEDLKAYRGGGFGGFGGMGGMRAGMGGAGGMSGGMGGMINPGSSSPSRGRQAGFAPQIELSTAKVDFSGFFNSHPDFDRKSPQEALTIYRELRKLHGRAPTFYWEAARRFKERGDDQTALRILGNLFEFGMADRYEVRRLLGYLFLQWDMPELAVRHFEKALALDQYDLGARRGLALAYSLRKNFSSRDYWIAKSNFDKILDSSQRNPQSISWGIDNGFRIITAVENLRNADRGRPFDPNPADAAEPIDADLRVVVTPGYWSCWASLAVTEPDGKKVNQANPLSLRGGMLNISGSSPTYSQYIVRRAGKGTYKITLTGVAGWQYDLPPLVFVDIFTNYGRPNETRRSVCIRLDEKTKEYEIGNVKF